MTSIDVSQLRNKKLTGASQTNKSGATNTVGQFGKLTTSKTATTSSTSTSVFTENASKNTTHKVTGQFGLTANTRMQNRSDELASRLAGIGQPTTNTKGTQLQQRLVGQVQDTQTTYGNTATGSVSGLDSAFTRTSSSNEIKFGDGMMDDKDFKAKGGKHDRGHEDDYGKLNRMHDHGGMDMGHGVHQNDDPHRGWDGGNKTSVFGGGFIGQDDCSDGFVNGKAVHSNSVINAVMAAKTGNCNSSFRNQVTSDFNDVMALGDSAIADLDTIGSTSGSSYGYTYSGSSTGGNTYVYESSGSSTGTAIAAAIGGLAVGVLGGVGLASLLSSNKSGGTSSGSGNNSLGGAGNVLAGSAGRESAGTANNDVANSLNAAAKNIDTKNPTQDQLHDASEAIQSGQSKYTQQRGDEAQAESYNTEINKEYNEQEGTVEELKGKVAEAEQKVKDAEEGEVDANENNNYNQDCVKTCESNYNKAQEEEQTAAEAVQTKQALYDKMPDQVKDSNGKLVSNTEKQDAKTELEKLKATLKEKQQAKQEADVKLEEARQKLDEAKKALGEAQAKLDKAKIFQEDQNTLWGEEKDDLKRLDTARQNAATDLTTKRSLVNGTKTALDTTNKKYEQALNTIGSENATTTTSTTSGGNNVGDIKDKGCNGIKKESVSGSNSKITSEDGTELTEKNGILQTSNGDKFTGKTTEGKYYKDGVVADNIEVDGKYCVKGQPATGAFNNIYYKDGQVSAGVSDEGVHYGNDGQMIKNAMDENTNQYIGEDGKPGTGVYKDTYYENGTAGYGIDKKTGIHYGENGQKYCNQLDECTGQWIGEDGKPGEHIEGGVYYNPDGQDATSTKTAEFNTQYNNLGSDSAFKHSTEDDKINNLVSENIKFSEFIYANKSAIVKPSTNQNNS